MQNKVNAYIKRLRERVGEGEYARHRELVHLLARNLSLEDVLWDEIMEKIKDVEGRNELLRQRNQIVRDIHTEFRALNIEIPTVVEQKTTDFIGFLEDLGEDDDSSKERGKET